MDRVRDKFGRAAIDKGLGLAVNDSARSTPRDR